MSASLLDSRLRGEPPGRIWGALILGGAFLLASAILAPRDPNLIKTLLPVFGATGWVTVLLRFEDRAGQCKDI